MASTRAGSKRLLRDLNQSIVFNLVAEQGSISRTELVKRSGLPAATITRIVGNFIAAGLVSEVTPEVTSEVSSAGRRPVLLSINPGAGHVIGVRLREDGFRVTVCDLNCTALHSSEAQLSDTEPHHVIEALAEAVKRCISEAGISPRSVLGVGIGLSGLIDSERGICRYWSILNWRDVELGPALEFKLHKPVRIDNDANTLAVAERYFGSGRDAANFLLVSVGRGVGMGIIVKGEIYRGSHGGAGEFGHMTVDTSADAPMCGCGKRGCLEAIASVSGILRTATGRDPGHHGEDAIENLVEQVRRGDESLRAIFARAGNTLGIAIANMINIFDPARVLLCGEGLRAGDLLLEPLRAAIPLHSFGPFPPISPIVHSMDETNWTRGAASLILREVFQPPIYESEEPLAIDELLSKASNLHSRKG